MNDIQNIVNELLKQKGNELIKNPSLFCSMIDDLVSGYKKERNILHKVLVSHREICNKLYLLLSADRYDERDIIDFKYSLQNDFGITDSWIEVIFDIFELSNNFTNSKMTIQKHIQKNISKDVQIVCETSEDNFEYMERDGNIVITKYNGKDKNVVIPRRINDKNVTVIGIYAFKNCINLMDIIISDNVISIGSGAFKDCKNLMSVSIPSSVRNIGVGTFNGCINLSNVSISSGVVKIDKYAFKDCINLKKIIIPSSVIEIGDAIFSNCTHLENIEIQNTEYYLIQDEILFNKSKTKLVQCLPCTQKQSYEIPDSVIEIGEAAFYGFSSFKSIFVPNSVKLIGDYAFSNCKNLTIYVKMFSYAQKYAKEHNIPFIFDFMRLLG